MLGRRAARAGHRTRLAINGSGFFDPGAGFAGRLQVDVAGGARNGVRALRVLRWTPTALRLEVDLGRSATPGPRDLVVRTPDGQTAVLGGGFIVRGPR